jgi:ribonuclease HI
VKEIKIHTDGSCLSNPGRGGWAVVIEDEHGRRELSGGARMTTNNRMEIRAAIEALRATPPDAQSLVTITTDSQLLVNSVEKGWAAKWRANNWKRNKTDKAENPDLWAQLLSEIEQRRVRFVWTKAHVGTLENERCDVLAKEAADRPTEIDEYYEAQRPATQSHPQLFDAAPAYRAPQKKEYAFKKNSAQRSIIISHPDHGRLEIPESELLPFLEQLRQTVALNHEKR